MSITLSSREITNSVERNGGEVWHRLHSEREGICEALLKEFRPGLEGQPGALRLSQADAKRAEVWHRELIEARLRKIDEALDRLMAGSYGNCRRCGRWIEDTKLDLDPAVAFCIFCWERIQIKH